MTKRPMTYLTRLPAIVPADQVLVHNHVRPARRLGVRGFRAWLSPSPPDATWLQVCDCAWAPELGRHFQVRPSRRGSEMDDELRRLYNQVKRVFGEAACAAANDRAFDRAASAKDTEPEYWLTVFDNAWKAELRQLLRPH